MFKTLQKGLLLTSNYLVYAIVITFAVFLVEFSPALVHYLNTSSGISENYAGQTISQYISDTLKNFNADGRTKELSNVLFWGFVGLLLYVGYLIFGNILIVARNELAVDIEQGKRGTSSVQIIKHAGGKLMAVVLFVAFLTVSVLYLAPYWLDSAQIYIYSGLHVVKLPYLLLGMGGFMVNLYFILSSAYLIWKYEESV